MAEELERISYEESLRSLDKQEVVLSEIHVKLQRLFRAFWLAALFLGLEVVLLLVSFASTLG